MRFEAVSEVIRESFKDPDIMAWRVAATVAASHYLAPEDLPPVWLMLVGPSGCGKTAILNSMSRLPRLHSVDTITPRAFLSGYRDEKGRSMSLLRRIGPDGILVCKDFGSLMGHSREDQAYIYGVLRRIYDGDAASETGMTGRLAWAGRMTMIAACTYAVETDRRTHTLLGDRFVEVKLRRSDRSVAMAIAHGAGNPRSVLQDAMQNYVFQACRKPEVMPEIPAQFCDEIVDMALFCAKARSWCEWDYHGRLHYSRDHIEVPSRLLQAMRAILLTSTFLEGRSVSSDEDMALVRRVAQGVVPSDRRRAILQLAECPHDKYAALAGWFSKQERWRILQELEAIGIIQQPDGSNGVEFLEPVPSFLA